MQPERNACALYEHGWDVFCPGIKQSKNTALDSTISDNKHIMTDRVASWMLAYLPRGIGRYGVDAAGMYKELVQDDFEICFLLSLCM